MLDTSLLPMEGSYSDLLPTLVTFRRAQRARHRHRKHPLSDEDARSLIGLHRKAFERLTRLYLARLRIGDHDGAARCAQIAAAFAYRAHAGFFASIAMEKHLSTIGMTLQPGLPLRQARSSDPARVLHVLTKSYSIGGHSRLAWRWIQSDSGRAHDVVLTAQHTDEAPPELRDAVDAAGGRLHGLGTYKRSPIARALDLRAIGATADHVVLHVHQDDVLPLLAFAQDAPPIIFMNHADHTFWCGASLADAVAHVRPYARHLSIRRRGIPMDRCTMLPVPLGDASDQGDDTNERHRLGIPCDGLVLLSVASRGKFASPHGFGFDDLVVPVLKEHDNVWLVLVGPDPNDAKWASASIATGGRIIALGAQEDIRSLYSIADIYLDSYPVSSLTSILEAGQRGLPLLRYAAIDSGIPPLHNPDDVALDKVVLNGTTIRDFRNQLRLLITDAAAREQAGSLTRERVIRWHVGAGWTRCLQDTYRVAATRRDATRNSDDQLDLLDDDDIAAVRFGWRSSANREFVRSLPHYCLDPPVSTAVRRWASSLVAVSSAFPASILLRDTVVSSMRSVGLLH